MTFLFLRRLMLKKKMNKEMLIMRITIFVVRILSFVECLPDTISGRVISNQISRSASSIGANYRAACRSKSKRDFINKLKMVEEETDETLYWLDITEECKLMKPEKLINLRKVGEELLSIFVSSIKTAKENIRIGT